MSDTSDTFDKSGVEFERRLDGRTCAWCGRYVPYSGRGRPPAYCSKSCRNRAWEVRTAERRLHRDIAAGAAAAGPVREVIRETRVITAPAERAESRGAPTTAHQWIPHLEECARQVREGELGRQHWYHVNLYDALTGVLAELAEMHPGGLKHLAREAARRRPRRALRPGRNQASSETEPLPLF
jgi:hypothetical protein